MSDQSPKRVPPGTRLATIGIEYAAAVAGFGLLGWWVDTRWDTKPFGVLIGAALGLIGATYNLVRESMAAFKVPPRSSDAEGEKDRERQSRRGE